MTGKGDPIRRRDGPSLRAGRDGRAADEPALTYRVLDAVAESDGGDDEVAELVRLARAGDELAFAELYVRLFDRVFRFLHLALKNREDAQDAAQETFLKVFRTLDSYDPARGRFESWLFGIVRNLATDRLRHRRRVEDVERRGLTAPATSIAERAATLVDHLDPDSGVRAMIERLPENQRRALVLRFVFDLATADAADVLGTTPDSVRHLQHRALKTLATELARAPDAA